MAWSHLTNASSRLAGGAAPPISALNDIIEIRSEATAAAIASATAPAHDAKASSRSDIPIATSSGATRQQSVASSSSKAGLAAAASTTSVAVDAVASDVASPSASSATPTFVQSRSFRVSSSSTGSSHSLPSGGYHTYSSATTSTRAAASLSNADVATAVASNLPSSAEVAAVYSWGPYHTPPRTRGVPLVSGQQMSNLGVVGGGVLGRQSWQRKLQSSATAQPTPTGTGRASGVPVGEHHTTAAAATAAQQLSDMHTSIQLASAATAPADVAADSCHVLHDADVALSPVSSADVAGPTLERWCGQTQHNLGLSADVAPWWFGAQGSCEEWAVAESVTQDAYVRYCAAVLHVLDASSTEPLKCWYEQQQNGPMPMLLAR